CLTPFPHTRTIARGIARTSQGRTSMDQSSSRESTEALPLRLATAPVNWNNNDIPGWRPITPFPEILDRVREAGYSSTEYDDSFGDDPNELNSESYARDITWCGSYQWVD